MSKLAGRAKSWAYGKRLAEPHCFYDLDDFKRELKKAFEPPQSEFRARAEFLKLRQGKYDLHSYAQRARYLVSSIVDEPIDIPTQVVTFMTGLNDGPIRNQLFREYPKTLEEPSAVRCKKNSASSKPNSKVFRQDHQGNQTLFMMAQSRWTSRTFPRLEMNVLATMETGSLRSELQSVFV
uniref:Retrotransposon gag domain-containing protein n=1 Tax=Globisporangium ultimum (strain ATCC 200006 / CBS 805.95 / DAOM BR144) TaxID=431595 RepID=K3WK71_GLOUD